MREQPGLAPSNGVQPSPRPGWPAAQSFELLHGPSHEMLVDALRQGVQLGAVEGPVVVDPASHLRVDLLGEAGQVRPAATVEVPGPDLPAFRFARPWCSWPGRSSRRTLACPGPADPGRCSRGSRSWCAPPLLGDSRPCSTRSSSSRGAAQVPWSRAARRARPAAAGPAPRYRSGQQCRPRSARTGSPGTPGPSTYRTHSRVARGISPPGSHGTKREPLDSLRSSHPVHRYARIHAQ